MILRLPAHDHDPSFLLMSFSKALCPLHEGFVSLSLYLVIKQHSVKKKKNIYIYIYICYLGGGGIHSVNETQSTYLMDLPSIQLLSRV